MDVQMRRALVFAILMENGTGIEGKSPDYMMEKWNSINLMNDPEWWLDLMGKGKYNEWAQKWNVQLKWREGFTDPRELAR